MPPIESFSPFRFNSDQQIAAGQLEDFIRDDVCRVFILKGHAGTGKTTLISALIRYATNIEMPVVLLASTGRAAKIVGSKAAYPAETVHKHIYLLDVEKADDENKIRRLIFSLKQNLHSENTLFIVDECSMLSDHAVKGVFIDFGSGKLLSDFFAYAGNRKVVFSGDPCQLPPINTAFSPALTSAYLSETHHKPVTEAALSEVMRYNSEAGLFKATTSLRQTIEQKVFNYLNIAISGHSDMHRLPNQSAMVGNYVSRIRQSGIESSIMLCYTNSLAAQLNQEVRAMLFPGKAAMVKGELLMVTQNNYRFNLANGEHMQVTETGAAAEHRAGLTFRPFTGYVNDESGSRIVTGLLIEELLYAAEASLSNTQEYELFKDFAVRMKAKGIKPRDESYLTHMLADPYLNAVRAKFGYAITCHKAQGGEWNHVYIILERSLFNPTARENQFRWAYTAISRGIQQVYFLDNICLK